MSGVLLLGKAHNLLCSAAAACSPEYLTSHKTTADAFREPPFPEINLLCHGIEMAQGKVELEVILVGR